MTQHRGEVPLQTAKSAADQAREEAASGDVFVWYASYGSNMSRDRFMCYIQGGRLNERQYEGCTDKTPPQADEPVTILHELFFGGWSDVWKGAMAYVRSEVGGAPTWGRMYLISYNQLGQIILQERGRSPTERTICPPLEYVVGKGQCFTNPAEPARPRRNARPTSYGRLLYLGSHVDGHPILTFTATGPDEQIKLAAPSEAYLQTIAAGLGQTHPELTKNGVVDYFSSKAGIRGDISVATLRQWLEQFNGLNSSTLGELCRLVYSTPAEAIPYLNTYEARFQGDLLWQSVRGPLFIDTGAAVKQEALIQKGIDYEVAALDTFKEERVADRLYNIANGYSSLEDTKRTQEGYAFDPDVTKLIQAKNFFREALRSSGAHPSPQLLVNYANCLSALGRTLEAIQMWRRALAIEPNFPMALGNLALGLRYFGGLSNDYAILPEAAEYLRRALQADSLNPAGQTRAKVGFTNELRIIEDFLARHPQVKERQAHSGLGGAYEQFCEAHGLFLALGIAEHLDSVRLTLITPAKDDKTYPRLARVVNEIKERYVAARLLLFEAENSDIDLQLDGLTMYADLSDGAVYGTRSAKLKLALRLPSTFSIRLRFFSMTT